jgi:putative FmdB family regulatory protein
MAFYDYTCPACGDFSLWRKLAERDLPAACPTCQAAAARALSAPNLSLMPAGRRQAFARNEKSRHEPGVTRRHQCGTGCGCGSRATPTRKSTRTVNLGKAGQFQSPNQVKRPWMLGH